MPSEDFKTLRYVSQVIIKADATGQPSEGGNAMVGDPCGAPVCRQSQCECPDTPDVLLFVSGTSLLDLDDRIVTTGQRRTEHR